MSIFNLFTPASATITQNKPVTSRKILSAIFGAESDTGIKVDVNRAEMHTTVISCWRVLSESLASMPLHLMQRELKDGKWIKKKAYEHPLYNLLHLSPNEENTSYNFIEALMLNIVSRGNAFAQIVRNNKNEIVAIVPLLTDNMQIVRSESNKLAYIYSHDKYGEVWLEKEEVIHIVGLSYDGVHGLSPIAYSANAIGMSIAMEMYGAKFFKNGANPTGVFEKDGVLSDEAFERLKASIEEKYTGLLNSSRPMLLEDGLKFNRITIANNEAQFLESRKFQKAEIASIYRVPLHMINELDRATHSNIEQQSIEFVTYTMTPWVQRFEQAFNKALFGNSSEYYVKFNMDALIRGDIESRYTAHRTAIESGWKTRNEVREQEGLNPLDGLDDPIIPLNMAKDGGNTDEEN